MLHPNDDNATARSIRRGNCTAKEPCADLLLPQLCLIEGGLRQITVDIVVHFLACHERRIQHLYGRLWHRAQGKPRSDSIGSEHTRHIRCRRNDGIRAHRRTKRARQIIRPADVSRKETDSMPPLLVKNDHGGVVQFAADTGGKRTHDNPRRHDTDECIIA